MHTDNKDKLNPYIFIPLIFLGVGGCIIMHLVNTIINIAQRDAWLVCVIGSFFSLALTWFLVILAKRFPKKNLFEYSRNVVGKPLSLLIIIGYLLFWLIFTIFLLADLIQINKVYFLQYTPISIQLLLIIFAVVWLACYGYPDLIRFFQLMLPFILLPLFLGLALSLKNVDLTSFLPLFANGFSPVIKGVIVYVGFMQGLEIILIIFPFLTGTKKTLRYALAGTSMINLTAFLLTTTAIGILGVDSANRMLWANMAVLELINVPGFPAERFDLLLTFAWLISLFCAISFFFFNLTNGFSYVFQFKKKKLIRLFFAAICIVSIYLIPNYSWNLKIWAMLNYVSLIFVFIIPFFVWSIALIRKKGGQNQ